jgi:hypothetical protein
MRHFITKSRFLRIRFGLGSSPTGIYFPITEASAVFRRNTVKATSMLPVLAGRDGRVRYYMDVRSRPSHSQMFDKKTGRSLQSSRKTATPVLILPTTLSIVLPSLIAISMLVYWCNRPPINTARLGEESEKKECHDEWIEYYYNFGIEMRFERALIHLYL